MAKQKLKQKPSVNLTALIVVGLLVAISGIYIVWKSFAAPGYTYPRTGTATMKIYAKNGSMTGQPLTNAKVLVRTSYDYNGRVHNITFGTFYSDATGLVTMTGLPVGQGASVEALVLEDTKKCINGSMNWFYTTTSPINVPDFPVYMKEDCTPTTR